MAYPPPPYKDAVTGIPVTGEAITGVWWAYPPSGSLGLQGIPPTLLIVNGDASIVIDVPLGNLGLQGIVPSYALSQVFAVPQAKLGLGAELPDRVGWIWVPSEEDVLGPWAPSEDDAITPVASLADTMTWIPSRAD